MRLKTQQDQLLQKLNLYKSKIFVNPNAVHHLRAISNLVPRSIALTSLTIAPLEMREDESGESQKSGVEKIVLRGIAFPAHALEGSNLAEFLLKLKNSGYFQSIEMVGQETQANGAIAFVINCYY
ncbi:MAG: PilN domain-containing protein [candidate division KSB1 bacterium]|nr:PilN domain-containing protein [candidate division KSB1 bacterium]